MTVDSNLPSNHTDEIFAQALERLEAGEPLEVIIAAAPAALHAELRDLLTVVAATHPLQAAELPRRDPARRAANRQAFLQVAATMRAEGEAQSPVVTKAVAAVPPVVTPAAAPAGRAKTAVAAPTWLDQLRVGWQNLTGSLAFSPVQLAPLVIMLTAISLSAFGFATVAQASVPGDIIYPAKQWLRQQELSLAAEEDRPDIVKKQEDETAEDIAKAIKIAAAQQKPRQATQTLFFRGWEEGNLLIGSLVVEPAYQINPSEPATAPMVMDATPAEGQQVILAYQILPTQNMTDTLGRQVVQGISLTVIEESLIVPTVTPTPCMAQVPSGWQPLVIRTGDTLNAISIRTGTNERALTEVNCLANPNLIYPGMRFFAPVPATATPTATPLPALAATLTAVSTTVSTEVVTPTQTVEPDATATLSTTIGLTPTVNISATAALTPTVTVTETEPETTPTITTTEALSGTVVPPAATPQPTPDLTVTLTAMVSTPATTAVMTTTVLPEAVTTPTPPVATEEATATAASDDTADDAGNETPTTSATDAPTTAVDASGNGDDTASTPTPVATVAPPTATPTPASEERSGGKSGDAVTLTPTAIDSSPLPASSG